MYIKLKNIIKKNTKPINVFFVGIGGVSMYSLAIYLMQIGHKIIGSDLQNSDNVIKLKKIGISVFNKHSSENIVNVDALIFNSATENSVEVLEAKKLNIPIFSRAELLGEILKTYKTPICVAGAHGKTTTTALIYSILEQAQKNPSLHLGGNLVENGKSYNYNNGEEIICEACEYKDSFLYFTPKISVILNIVPEHLDYFKNFGNIVKSFKQFASNSHIVICEKSTKHLLKAKTITFGLDNANFTAKDVHMLNNGTYSFNCHKDGKFYARFEINLIGQHNILNALASICVADLLQIRKKDIIKALKNFKGIERRFQYLNTTKFIVHDYAHHPDEIKAIINETQKFYKHKLLVVFQPHTYSRTKTLIKDFIEAFKSVNEVVIYKTYSAREKYDYKGSACYLSKKLGTKSKYFRNCEKITNHIIQKINDGYGVLFLGAGDIDKLAKNINKLC